MPENNDTIAEGFNCHLRLKCLDLAGEHITRKGDVDGILTLAAKYYDFVRNSLKDNGPVNTA